jgi:hemoglobin/transferrin/lactoferrin receptor protein
MRFLLLFCIACPFIKLSSLHAQATTADTASILKPEVVVTAHRFQTDNYSQPLVTTLLKKEQLQRRMSRTAPEALFGAAGVFLQKTNHGGGSPFVRGLTGQQILMLVDGIRLNNATFRSGPNQYLNTLDPSWIHRIEILESSGSVAYGSDAIGGVIHVQTQAPEFAEKTIWRPALELRSVSSGMEYSGSGALQASARRWAFRVGGAYRDFGDLLAGKGLGVQAPNAYTQWAYDAKAQFKLHHKVNLLLAWQDLQQRDVPVYHKVQLENFKFNNFDLQRRYLGYAKLEINPGKTLLQKITLTYSQQFSHEVRESQKNNSATQVYETDKTLTDGLQLAVLSKITEGWFMSSGVEWYTDGVRSDKKEINENSGAELLKRGLYPDNSKMQSMALYNMHNIRLHRWLLSGGLRYNAFSIRIPDQTLGTSTLKPSALVGNAGVSYELLRGLRIFANGATAFRAPNVDDLGTLGIVDFRYEVPNYALSPEKSRSIEGGFKVQTAKVLAALSVYYMQLSDLIGRVRTNDSISGYAVYRKENISEAFVRGATLQSEWHPLRALAVGGHATYTYGQNTSAAEPMRRIPPFNGRLWLTYTLRKTGLSINAESVFAADQRRLAKGDIDDNRIADEGTPGWKIFNIGLFYQKGIFSIGAEGHNLFNEAYRTHGSGVDGLGRCLRLQCRLNW